MGFWSQIFDTKGIYFFGIGDSETGISLFGLSLSKPFNEKQTLFFVARTFVYVNPICTPFKQYIRETDNKSSYLFFQFSMLHYEQTIKSQL